MTRAASRSLVPERSLAAKLLDWYDAGHRDLPWRRTANAYRIWVSEIMLQQTRAEAVIPYYERFLECFPDAAALAGASEQQVLASWSGLGYYSRARNLHRAAKLIRGYLSIQLRGDPATAGRRRLYGGGHCEHRVWTAARGAGWQCVARDCASDERLG